MEVPVHLVDDGQWGDMGHNVMVEESRYIRLSVVVFRDWIR